ncbi:MAG: hypothetical protein AB7H80_00030 [Candidatus Kapaibacterium sp.]
MRSAILFLSLVLLANQSFAQTEDSTAVTSAGSFFSPQFRAFQFDVAKLVLCFDAEVNLDIDLFHPIPSTWIGLRAGMVNTGEDNTCIQLIGIGHTPPCRKGEQYYHLDMLGYGSIYRMGSKNPLRFSLLGGISNATTNLKISDSTLRVKLGGEIQIRLTGGMAVGLGFYSLLGYPEGMSSYFPLKFNLGYARW